MADLLDTSMAALARGGMARAVKAIKANTALDVKAATDLLVNAACDSPRLTLAKVLGDEGIHNLDQIDVDLRTLDRAESARTAAYAQAKALDDDQLTPTGNVRLTAEPEEVARWLEDPVAREARYRTARGFDPRYEDQATGRQAWIADDRMQLDVGVDLLKTLGRKVKLAQALAPAQRLDRMVDRAWRAGSDPGERVKLLDAAIGEHRAELRLLDQATPAPDRVRLHGRMLLDQGDPNDRGRALAAAVEARLAAEGRPWSDFMMVLDEVLAA
jgi:hypothetical protein